MKKSFIKIIGLFVFLFVFAITMAGCDMMGNNVVEDTARGITDASETGDLEVIVNKIDVPELVEAANKVGAQSVIHNRFTDFKLIFTITHQTEEDVNYSKTIDLDDDDIIKDNFGDDGISMTFTGLKECNYDVEVNLYGTNTGTEEENVMIASGKTEASVIAGLKRSVNLEVQQSKGNIKITVDQFPSEVTGGEIIRLVNIKLLDLKGNEIENANMDFDHDTENQYLLVEDLFPAYYTMVISWNDGQVREEVQVRVIPGKTIDIPVTLFGSQLTVNVDWYAEPGCPQNITVTQTPEGFKICWYGGENAEWYNILRKRTPYYHDGFMQVGQVDHEDGKMCFVYEINKPELFEIATYEFKVVSVREHPGKLYNLTSEPCGPETLVFECTSAFGGKIAGDGPAWWFYFDTGGPGIQPIYADRDIKIGYVTINAVGNDNGEGIEAAEYVENDEVKISIEFINDWGLCDLDDDDAVKVQGYNEGYLPGKRPAAGLFETYKGNDLEFTVPAFDYYVIKLDVYGEVNGL